MIVLALPACQKPGIETGNDFGEFMFPRYIKIWQSLYLTEKNCKNIRFLLPYLYTFSYLILYNIEFVS